MQFKISHRREFVCMQTIFHCFYCNFAQINAALVSRRDSFKNIKRFFRAVKRLIAINRIQNMCNICGCTVYNYFLYT